MDAALRAFGDLLQAPDDAIDLGRAALAVARIEHPQLDDRHELARLDALAARVGAARDAGGTLDRLRRFLFQEEGFRGNDGEYYDPRNSCLNDVLDRKLGIPITLSVLTMEVGRRIGLDIEQRDARHPRHGPAQRFDRRRVPAFGEIRDAFDQGCRHWMPQQVIADCGFRIAESKDDLPIRNRQSAIRNLTCSSRDPSASGAA